MKGQSMSEFPFEIWGYVSLAGFRQNYSMTYMRKNDFRVQICPPDRLAEGLAFAKTIKLHGADIGNKKQAPSGQVFDLDFSAFAEFPQIHRVYIRDNFKVGKVTGIETFYKTRTHTLGLSGNINFPIDFHRLTRLQILQLTETAKLKIRRLPASLLRLEVCKLSGTDLSVLSDTPKLNSLEISGTKITGLNGLQSCTELEDLTVSSAPLLADLSALNHCTGLKSLRLERCPLLGRQQMESLVLPELRELAMHFDVDSLSFLGNFPKLEKLSFKEVADGNLKPILETGLRCADFPGKKRNTHSPAKINRLLMEKNEKTG